ncbi:MAG: protein kinase domain-containing protein [Planctomycetota bacterium]|jgi:serine/threonine protein kinase
MDICLSQELVERYITQSCSEDEIQAVEAHLATCQSCRQRIEFIRSNIAAPGQSDSNNTHNENAPYKPDDKTHVNQQDEFITRSLSQEPSPPHTAQPAAAPLQSMFEGYNIRDQLPLGGQAVVYRATQKATKRIVALKVLLQGPHASVRAQYRFEREVDLAASLQHPNIVTIYDSGIAQGQYYFAMEYIDGKPLDEYVQSEKLPLRQTMELFNKVCSAVAYAHQRGVMHRDLKPGNILVDDNAEPHILDFGLAKLVDASQQTTPEAVMTSIPGKVIGTLAFMSPEQASAQPDAVDVRTDVYSIGMILYKILTDNFPYDVSGSMLAILRNIQETEPTRPSKLISHFNSEVEAILLKTLTKEPDRRYQSAAHLQQDIDAWLKGLPVSAKADSSIYLLRKIITRHRYASSVVALLLIIVFSFSCFYYQLYTRLRETNVNLQSANRSLKEETVQLTGFTGKVMFTKFLQPWHAGWLRQSQGITKFLVKGTREYKAAAFLLDQRPLTDKITEFRQNLGKSEPCFTEFIIAEHYLKNSNRAEAIKSYRQCLLHKAHLNKDQWLVIQIKSRLYELTNENKNDKTSLKVDD